MQDIGYNATEFKADTIPGQGEKFSVGRIIPVENTEKGWWAGIFTGQDTEFFYYSGVGRINGQPRQEGIISNDFSFVVLSVSLLLLTLLSVFGRKGVFSGFASLSFRHQADTLEAGTTEVLSWQPVIRNLFSMLNVGLFASASLMLTGITGHGMTAGAITLTAIISGSFLAALILRHLALILIAEISGHRTLFREYMNIIYNAWFADALVLFILNVIILFTPVSNPVTAIIAGIISTAIFLIIRALRLLYIFLNRHISIFYFILYLCALEVLPVLVLLKILGVF